MQGIAFAIFQDDDGAAKVIFHLIASPMLGCCLNK